MSDPIIIPVAPQALSVRILSDEQAMSAGINPAIFRGKNAYLHIRYAPNGSPMDDEIGTIPNEYIGLCTNDNPEAPTTADSYVWIHISHQNAEDARVAAEQARATAEQDRIAVESARVAAESDRASAEQGRVTAEAARETAEAAREAAPKYLHIRYAEVENPGDGQILTTPNDYIGTAVTANSVAPTSASAYQWARFRGHDGTGTGDMHTSIYDPTQSGVVLRAAQADALADGATVPVAQVNGLGEALAAKVPTTRKVNGKALDVDVTLGAEDVGARAADWTPTASDVGAAEAIHTHSGYAPKATIATGTLTVAGWTGTAAPYTQTLTIAGVPGDQAVPVHMGMAETITLAQIEAWGKAVVIGSAHAAGSVTFKALKDKPTVDLPVVIEW